MGKSIDPRLVLEKLGAIHHGRRPQPSSASMSFRLVIPGGLRSRRARFRFTSREQNAVSWSCRSRTFQRTANSVLTGCLSPGDKPNHLDPVTPELHVQFVRVVGVVANQVRGSPSGLGSGEPGLLRGGGAFDGCNQPARWKWPFITRWADFPNPNQPTDSAEEAMLVPLPRFVLPTLDPLCRRSLRKVGCVHSIHFGEVISGPSRIPMPTQRWP